MAKSNVFKEAKKIRRKHPRMPWQTAVKKAGRSVKRRNRQTGTSNKKRDERIHSKRPGKRKSRTGKTYYERRKNRSDVPGHLTGMSISTLKRTIRQKVEDTLGKKMVSRIKAHGVRAKNRIGKEITKLRTELRKLS